MSKKIRVDDRMVELGLVEDLEQARKLVMAGRVLSDGQLINQPSQTVPAKSELALVPDQRFVSRGGEKLQAALDQFSVVVSGKVCADVGASTGGFSDCLLQAGAKKVYAIDVGYGLLDWKLRNDPRVVVMERTNARNLMELPEPITFLTADVSFISLKMILPRMAGWLSPQGGEGVVLIKPQFEATKEESASGEGVISDPVVHQRVLTEVLSYAGKEDFSVQGVMRSPLIGPAGNIEFLAWLSTPIADQATENLEKMISRIFK